MQDPQSPALDISELLRQNGADVRYDDPYVAQFAHSGHGLCGEPDLAQALVDTCKAASPIF